MNFSLCLVAFFSCFCILALRTGAVAVDHCHTCGGVPTPTTSVLDVIEHITTMTVPIEPLHTEFHYAEYLYINDFQLLKWSAFPPNSTYAGACYSGNIALLSDGSEKSIGFGTPDGENYNSNYRYLNLSSMVSSK
ncbi:hypothetical protein POJ06DRAFT_191059 [Lipomyces tetrasporus]|uniref:Uncharacterized protein n=1 Tax=Lipomyces tetrasporus TaxID=54092 RepID=A0AAD7VVN1_9ASCO|nr:uncharacterized protein POJ06DRAFT_191059 [Lipomyces tetrasporus]KAJ8103658.1 hypothetical protein POJ06DRAFT_191059 [Lipomyces tetrasporus]